MNSHVDISSTNDVHRCSPVGSLKRRKTSLSDETQKTVCQDINNLQKKAQTLRIFKKIPIFIVDSHNDVMVFIYRAIASRYLPLHDNILIHFDSHPDMVVDRQLNVQTTFKKQELLDNLSIENWIIPACFTGQFGRIIWIKNSWSKQLDPGHYDFMVGSVNNKLGVDLPHNYFIAEGSYYESQQLTDSRRIKLDVCEMDTQHIDPSVLFNNADEANRCILDIDLDYFSTANPFLEIYPLANCYEQLKSIFKFQIIDDVGKASANRRKQLNTLQYIFENLQKNRTFTANFELNDEIFSSDTLDLIENLRLSLCKNYEEFLIDWLQIFNAGLTTDNQGLPNHLSSEAELEMHFNRFETFLKKLPFSPKCVTIACSADDEYTPINQMPIILNRVLDILRAVFAENIYVEPIRFDGTENFNILQL